MKSVLISINKPHTDNIKAGLKRSELRKRPPKLVGPYRAYIYETKKNGGCGAVIGEFTATNKERWRTCVGIPFHLCADACVTAAEIYKYCRNGLDDITEIAISKLVIYGKPKELSEFVRPCDFAADCGFCGHARFYGHTFHDCGLRLTRPPQSWMFVEELKCAKEEINND